MTYPLLFRNHREQVALLAVVHDDKHKVAFGKDAIHSDDGWVAGRELMQRNLSSLKMSLPRVQPSLIQALYGAVHGDGVARVNCKVDDTVGTGADDGNQFQAALVDDGADEVRVRVRLGEHVESRQSKDGGEDNKCEVMYA